MAGRRPSTCGRDEVGDGQELLMVAYFPVRLAAYGVILVVMLLVLAVKKLQSAVARVNPGTFVPETSVITRDYTPKLADPMATLAQIGASLPGVSLASGSDGLFFEVRVAGGMFVRVRATQSASTTRVEVSGRRKVSGLETVKKAEDGLMAFESAMRRQLATQGYSPSGVAIPQVPAQTTLAPPVRSTAPAAPAWLAPRPLQAEPFTITFDTGSAATTRGVAVIGRDPVLRSTDVDAILLPLNDPTMSVSKTHLAIGRDGSGFWVQDRSSTNGSQITEPDGNVLTVIPERTVRVQAGSRVAFGDRWLEVR